MHKRTIKKIKVILLNNFGSRYYDLRPDIREQVFSLVAKEVYNEIEIAGLGKVVTDTIDAIQEMINKKV